MTNLDNYFSKVILDPLTKYFLLFCFLFPWKTQQALSSKLEKMGANQYAYYVATFNGKFVKYNYKRKH